MIVDK